jgi:hypothetical protein
MLIRRIAFVHRRRVFAAADEKGGFRCRFVPTGRAFGHNEGRAATPESLASRPRPRQRKASRGVTASRHA